MFTGIKVSKLKKRVSVVLFILLAWQGAYAKNSLEALRYSTQKDSMRLVFEFKEPPHYTVSKMLQTKIYIDIDNTALSKNFKKQVIPRSFLKSVQYTTIKNDLRITLDLKQTASENHFILPGNKTAKNRLVVDLGSQANVGSQSSVELKSVASSASLNKPLRKVIVVVDPGHGGKDPGAAGSRLREKDVVLAISKYLAEYINNDPGMKAVLTRSGDYFVPLRDRLKLGRKGQADLFVAVHADAFQNTEAQGASIYALSERGATSEAARWLAQNENNAVLMGEVGGIDLSNKSRLLRSVLLDLSQTATIESSLELGRDLLSSMSGVTSLHRKRVEQAGFVVLKSPDIPSVLIELGFISNREEESRLGNTDFRKRLAYSIYQGIKEYVYARPPEGTFISEEKHSSIKHKKSVW